MHLEMRVNHPKPCPLLDTQEKNQDFHFSKWTELIVDEN